MRIKIKLNTTAKICCHCALHSITHINRRFSHLEFVSQVCGCSKSRAPGVVSNVSLGDSIIFVPSIGVFFLVLFSFSILSVEWKEKFLDT